MEAVCLSAELRLRDGQNQTFSVPVGSGLSALRGGISELNANVSRFLSELVEREKARDMPLTRFISAADDEDKVNEDDEDEDALDSEPQPAAKKSKTTKNS